MSFAGLLLTLALAQATTSPTANWGLTWTAPSGCIRTAELAERIEQHFQRPLFGTNPGFHIDGYAAAASPGWRARLTLLDANNTVLGTRELSTPEPDCRTLDERLVLITALMIQPVAAPAPAPAPATPPPPLPRRTQLAVTDDGRYLDGGRRIERVVFYGMARRGDLISELNARRALRNTVLTVGIIALAAGAAVLLSAALGAGCESYSGSPSSPGSCVRPSTGLLIGGGGALAAGLASVLFSIAWQTAPTSLDEDRALAKAANERRQAER